MSTFWIRIYSDIRLCQDFDSNIFGYSFVSIFRTQTDSEDVFVDFLCILYFAYGYFVDINDKKCYLDCKSTELVPVLTNIFEYSNIFYSNIFYPNIYSDIRSYQNFNTNIFGYSFVSKSIRMSHSVLNTSLRAVLSKGDSPVSFLSCLKLFSNHAGKGGTNLQV